MHRTPGANFGGAASHSEEKVLHHLFTLLGGEVKELKMEKGLRGVWRSIILRVELRIFLLRSCIPVIFSCAVCLCSPLLLSRYGTRSTPEERCAAPLSAIIC